MVETYDNCFVCGGQNPIGLKLNFITNSEGTSRAEVKLSSNFEGYANMIHGGITASLLDEAMAKAIIATGLVAVTVQLSVSYKRGLIPNETYVLESEIKERRKKIITATARIVKSDMVLAEAEAKFFIIDKTK